MHSQFHSFVQIGFGTIWAVRELIDSAEAPCAYSMGSAATSEYQAISGCSADDVPIDQGGCAHWDESCFLDELMSSSLGPTDANNEIEHQLSRITLAALDDLGYSVDYNAADPFAHTDMNPSCTCMGRNRPGDTSTDTTVPTMSPELRAKAVAYGKGVLKDKHQRRQRRLKSQPRFRSDDDYVGDKALFLVLRENGHRFSLVVTDSSD